MASSGNFATSDSGNHAPAPDRMRFYWLLDSQSQTGNYSDISWYIRGSTGTSGYWIQNHETKATVNGTTSTKGSTQMYQNVTYFSGTRRINHNSNGTKTFSVSVTGRIFYNTVNSTGSKSYTLPTIPRYAVITSFSTQLVTDTTMTFNVKTDVTCDILQYRLNGGSWVTAHSGNFTNKTFTISGLTVSTTYTIQVRVRRDSSGLYTTSSTHTKTTDPNAISTINTVNVTDTSFRINITTNITCNIFSYRIDGGAWVTAQSSNFTSSFFILDQLLSDRSYDVNLRVHRTDNSNYNYSGTFSVKTLAQNKFFDVFEF